MRIRHLSTSSGARKTQDDVSDRVGEPYAATNLERTTDAHRSATAGGRHRRRQWQSRTQPEVTVSRTWLALVSLMHINR